MLIIKLEFNSQILGLLDWPGNHCYCLSKSKFIYFRYGKKTSLSLLTLWKSSQIYCLSAHQWFIFGIFSLSEGKVTLPWSIYLKRSWMFKLNKTISLLFMNDSSTYFFYWKYTSFERFMERLKQDQLSKQSC